MVDKDFIIKNIPVINSGADLNCIKRLTKYFYQTTQTLISTGGSKLN